VPVVHHDATLDRTTSHTGPLAARTAAELATPGDVVLLSPACASFDWYDGYAARGDDFRREVEALLAEAPS